MYLMPIQNIFPQKCINERESETDKDRVQQNNAMSKRHVQEVPRPNI